MQLKPLTVRITAQTQASITVWVPERFMLQWRYVMSDLTVTQACAYAREIMRPHTKWNNQRLLAARCAVAGVQQGDMPRYFSLYERRHSTRPSEHHIRASSRGGGRDNNIVTLPRGFHASWHELLGNSMPQELPTILGRIMQDGQRWSAEAIAREIAMIGEGTDAELAHRRAG